MASEMAQRVKDAVRSAMIWDLFAKAVTEQAKYQRAEAVEMMTDLGSLKQRVDDTTGSRLGQITIVGGETEPAVLSRTQLQEWVAKNRPDMLIQSVNPAYEAALLDEVRREGQAVDKETGAVIPGLGMINKPSHARFLPDRAAKEAANTLVREMAAKGGPRLTELGAGPDARSGL